MSLINKSIPPTFSKLKVLILLLLLVPSLSVLAQNKQQKNDNKRQWEDVQKDFKKQFELNQDSIGIALKQGLEEAQKAFKDMKVLDDGKVIMQGDTINMIAPMKGLIEGLEVMGKSWGSDNKELESMRDVMQQMPEVLKQGLQLFSEGISKIGTTDTDGRKKRKTEGTRL